MLEVLRLHTRERVERRHERKLQLVLQRVARDTREPVVGMDQRGLVAREDPFAHTRGELADEPRQVVLVDGLGRARDHVVDAEAGLDRDHRGQTGLRGTGVDVARQPGAGERSRELAHVHVHAPAVTGAGLRQR